MKRINRLAAALFCAGFAALAVTGCSGGKSTSSSRTTTSVQASTAPVAAPKKSTASGVYASIAAGKTLYASNCSSCHQLNGQGQPGAFPPLAHNAVVTGNPATPIHIIKNGLQASITVNGTSYFGRMPAWKSALTSAQIADVLSYVRSSWGNHAAPVTAKQVASTP